VDALPREADVVVVGAGPSGLTLSALLAAQGVDCVTLDAKAEGATTSRAAVVHARTMEVLEQLDVSRELLDRGIVVQDFTVHDRQRSLLSISFRDLPTAYPFTLMIPQNETEAVLAARLRALGGHVHRPSRVIHVEQDEKGAAVVVTDGEGAEHTIRAGYVVGADGMHSVVRDDTGIGFSGGEYDRPFILADVRMDWPRSTSVELLLSPEGVTVVAPLPGDRYRVVATVEQAPSDPGLRDVQRILSTRGPGNGKGVRVNELLWSSRFRVHHRVADRFRVGRVLLIGDAAHVHSPAGGQGMNTGIQDAVGLGRVLVAVVRGEESDEALDAYERTRRTVARQVVDFTDRMTTLATLRSPAKRMVRNHLLTALGHLPAFRHRLAMQLAELDT
jgi:2-polyprenyl-6-methoxyphenol hydroxylase-like FAD-dependent oxidoreductase